MFTTFTFIDHPFIPSWWDFYFMILPFPSLLLGFKCWKQHTCKLKLLSSPIPTLNSNVKLLSAKLFKRRNKVLVLGQYKKKRCPWNQWFRTFYTKSQPFNTSHYEKDSYFISLLNGVVLCDVEGTRMLQHLVHIHAGADLPGRHPRPARPRASLPLGSVCQSGRLLSQFWHQCAQYPN